MYAHEGQNEKAMGVQVQFLNTLPHRRLHLMHHYYIPHHCLLRMEERTESDKYKQWDGCVEGNYLPEPLARCQHEDIHLFCTESDSRARRRGGRGKNERVNKTRESAS